MFYYLITDGHGRKYKGLDDLCEAIERAIMEGHSVPHMDVKDENGKVLYKDVKVGVRFRP